METAQIGYFRTIGIKMMMMGLGLVVLIGCMDVAASFGDDRGRGRGKHYENDRHDNRGRGYYRGHHGRREYRTTVYRERVYVPPPVYYVPPPAPGISIMLPPLFFRP